jgi:hypothetical protein
VCIRKKKKKKRGGMVVIKRNNKSEPPFFRGLLSLSLSFGPALDISFFQQPVALLASGLSLSRRFHV